MTSTSTTLQPGTFTSILPSLNGLLSILKQLSEGDEKEAGRLSDEMIQKAREMSNQLKSMKDFIRDLPGGNLTLGEIDGLTKRLEDEAERRRRILRAFTETRFETVESVLKEEKGGNLDV